jgi:hypothetical protein
LAPEGGLGGGLQSTVWLYVLSHVGFALFAIVYTLLKDADPMEWLSPRSIRARVLTTVGSVTALVCCATVFVTAGHALLPRIMLDTAEVSYLWYYGSDRWRDYSSSRLSCYGCGTARCSISG